MLSMCFDFRISLFRFTRISIDWLIFRIRGFEKLRIHGLYMLSRSHFQYLISRSLSRLWQPISFVFWMAIEFMWIIDALCFVDHQFSYFNCSYLKVTSQSCLFIVSFFIHDKQFRSSQILRFSASSCLTWPLFYFKAKKSPGRGF